VAELEPSSGCCGVVSGVLVAARCVGVLGWCRGQGELGLWVAGEDELGRGVDWQLSRRQGMAMARRWLSLAVMRGGGCWLGLEDCCWGCLCLGAMWRSERPAKGVAERALRE
jgi:hypothetical protein